MLSLKPIIINGAAALSYTSKNCNRDSLSCRASASLAMGSKKKKTSNFYELLSLESEDVGVDEIKKAYRSLALRYHPDVRRSSTKEESTDMFVQLHQAYVTLSDPSSRKAYDTELLLTGESADGVLPRSRSKGLASRETWDAQLQGLVRRSKTRERAREVGRASFRDGSLNGN